MPRQVYSFIWRGQPYRFFRLRDAADGTASEWAVARAGEFIGTMPCVGQSTAEQFEEQCLRWLRELLGQD